METYVWINPERIKVLGRTLKVDGFDIEIEPSPYDMPSGVIGKYSPSSGLFEIEFRYIDDEPAKKEPSQHGDMQVFEGRYSGKIVKLTIPVSKPPYDKLAVISLTTRLHAGLQDLTDTRESKALDLILNQQIASEVIDDNIKKLVGATD